MLTDLRRALRGNKTAYVWLNVATYGALALAFTLTLLIPPLRDLSTQTFATFTSLPGLSDVLGAYDTQNVLLSALLTFAANVVFAAFLTTALPSLVIPYFGVAATVARAGFIGLWLAPTTPEQALALLPHAPIVVLEMQAYVLASLGSYILTRKTLAHRQLGLASVGAGYRSGLRDNVPLYLAVVTALLVLAVAEAVEVNLILPLLA